MLCTQHFLYERMTIIISTIRDHKEEANIKISSARNFNGRASKGKLIASFQQLQILKLLLKCQESCIFLQQRLLQTLKILAQFSELVH